MVRTELYQQDVLQFKYHRLLTLGNIDTKVEPFEFKRVFLSAVSDAQIMIGTHGLTLEQFQAEFLGYGEEYDYIIKEITRWVARNMDASRSIKDVDVIIEELYGK